MYKGIYIALSGALLKQRNMDIHAQNMANATTTGYKKERMSFKDYLVPVDNRPAHAADGRVMTELSNVVTDFSNGTIARTGNALDVAINGKGFFALEGNKYTRNGTFKITDDGYLATLDDVKVLGDGGPISLQGARVDINDSGEVFVDGVSAGILKIVDFPDKDVLLKLGGGVFTSKSDGEAVTTGVSQGYLEGSNVDAMREMVQMLTSFREFESYQKMIQSFDEASSKTINEMGK